MISRINIISKFLLLLLVLLSAGIIFYKFPAIPQNLAYDEVDFAKLALSLDGKPYTPYSPLATGHSTMYFYILLASLKTFGINTFALRLPSAIFGVLNTILVYLVFSKVFARRDEEEAHEKNSIEKVSLFKQLTSVEFAVPLLVTFAFVTLRWHFNFARFSFEATFVLLLELASTFFLLKFKETDRYKYVVLCGIFAGLAYNSYTPGRIFFVLPLFFIIFGHSWRNIFSKKTFLAVIFYVIPFVALIFPLTNYLAHNPDIRINQVSYISNPKLDIHDKITFFIDNSKRNIGMFFNEGDRNGRQNYPAKSVVNLILAVCFFLGMACTLREKKHWYSQFFVFYFFLALFPTLLTYTFENPHSLRTFTIIPSMLFFIGIFLKTILAYSWPKNKIYVIILVITMLAVSALYELRTYFIFQAQVFPNSFEMRGSLEDRLKD